MHHALHHALHHATRPAPGQSATRRASVAIHHAVALAMMALLGGCGPMTGKDHDEARTVTVTGSGPVTLTIGDTLAVTLAANPSTGYSWGVATAPAASVLASQGDPTYVSDYTGSVPMAGAGGKATIRFVAAGAGATRLVLTYRRGWEGDVPPVQTVTVDVTVTAAGG
jgi:predicted secreted protein